jgi:hypothetical protein
MKMWKTDSWNDLPVEVEIDRCTDKSVWPTAHRPVRELRITDGHQYHETYAEAIEAIRKRMQDDIDHSTSRIHQAQDRLKKATENLAAFNAAHPQPKETDDGE